MKMKVLSALLLALIGCVGTVSTICAGEVVITEEAMEVNNGDVQPADFCLECTSIMQMQKICLPASRTYAGTREHGYGLFWSKTCTVDSYQAMAGHYCDVCGNFIPIEDEEQSDGYGRHHCLEVHSACGQGNYLVCPFEG